MAADLSLVEGTGGNLATARSTGSSATKRASIEDPDGGTWIKLPPGALHPSDASTTSSGNSGGTGGEPMIDIAGLKQNVGFLNWAVATIFALGLAAIIGSYLLLNGELGQLDRTVAGQTATLSGMEKTLGRIEDRINGDQPQGSVGNQQAGPVRR